VKEEQPRVIREEDRVKNDVKGMKEESEGKKVEQIKTTQLETKQIEPHQSVAVR